MPVVKNPEHMAWEQVLQMSEVCRGMHFPRVAISGGEPTLSPILPKLGADLRQLFSAKFYELRTNGILLRDCLADLGAFDIIGVSCYPGRSPSDVKSLVKIDSRIRLSIKYSLHRMDRSHHSNQHGRPWKRCGLYRVVNVVGDRIYPCCTLHGLAVRRGMALDDVSIAVQPGWPEKLDGIDMSRICRECSWPT